MKRNNLEAFIGFLVVIACCSFSFYVYRIREGSAVQGNSYHLSGVFRNVEGIQIGSDVKIGGIKIGRVVNQEIDQNNYTVKVTVAITGDIKIPVDSWLVISTSGILGKTYLEIRPGNASDLMTEGDHFELTESATNLGDLITKFAMNRKPKN